MAPIGCRGMIKTEGCPVEMLQACCKACVELEDEPMLLGLTSRIEEVVSNDPISCRLVAGHYLKKDDFLTAAPYLARSLKREPDHLVTLEILAECFERAGEVEARDHTLERIQAVQSPSQEAPVNSPEDIPSQVHEHAAESLSIEAAEDASTPLVTAFVSTYASENFMRGCLEDLLNQTLGKRLEIIVIDSGSPEREGDIVREYQKNHPNIRYIHAKIGKPFTRHGIEGSRQPEENMWSMPIRMMGTEKMPSSAWPNALRQTLARQLPMEILSIRLNPTIPFPPSM